MFHHEHFFIFCDKKFIQCSWLDGILLAVRTVQMRTFIVLYCWEGQRTMTQLPSDQHITYQLQYRKCGKPSCSTCRDGQGHGPYWYAYWREGSRLRSGYIGKVPPEGSVCATAVATS